MNSQPYRQQKRDININDYTYVKPFDKDMYERLYDYQKETVQWIFQQFLISNNYFKEKGFLPSLMRENTNFSALRGVLVGHSMGLGKTAISCSLLQLLFSNRLIRYAIIIVPKSLIEQWASELPRWCRAPVFRYQEDRARVLQQFLQKSCAILLTTYKIAATEALTLQAAISSRRRPEKRFQNAISACLEPSHRDISFDLSILEEATFIKNDQTYVYKALKQLNVFFKIALTGTPIMNNLMELYTLVDFINPGFLGLRADFKRFYATQIEQSKVKDAGPGAKHSGQLLREKLAAELAKMMIRYTKEQLRLLRARRIEIVVWSDLPAAQRGAMLGFIDNKDFRRSLRALIARAHTPFQYIAALRKVCDHTLRIHTPDFRLVQSDENLISFIQTAQNLYKQRVPDIQMVLADTLTDQEVTDYLTDIQSTTGNLDTELFTENIDRAFNFKEKNTFSQTLTYSNYQKQIEQLQQLDNQLEVIPSEQESKIVDILNYHMGIKYSIILTLAQYFTKHKLKTLIFAEHTTTLDIIGFTFRQAGISYYRFDGTISKTSERQRICEMFQQSNQTFILMMTSRVGSYGLNLQEARRVIIFSPTWNMTVEEQAIGRAYRLGQKENVLVYKLVQRYTIEEKLFARQLHKFQISNVTGDQGAILKAKERDIKELFNFSHFEANSDAEQLKLKIDQLKLKQMSGISREEWQLLRQMEQMLSKMGSETVEETCKRLFGEIDQNLEDIQLIEELKNQFLSVNINCTNIRTKTDDQFDSTQYLGSDDSDVQEINDGIEILEEKGQIRYQGNVYSIVPIDKLRQWAMAQNPANHRNDQQTKLEKQQLAINLMLGNASSQKNNKQLIDINMSTNKNENNDSDSLEDIFNENNSPNNSSSDDKETQQSSYEQNVLTHNQDHQQSTNTQQDIISISESNANSTELETWNNQVVIQNEIQQQPTIYDQSNDLINYLYRHQLGQQIADNNDTHSSADDGAFYDSNAQQNDNKSMSSNVTFEQCSQTNKRRNEQVDDGSDIYTVS